MRSHGMTDHSKGEYAKPDGTHSNIIFVKLLRSARNLLCWFWPHTPQDLWNILLVIFTFALAVVAWKQYASDAAYLTLGPTTFVTASGMATIGIENDGRRPSSEVITTLYNAYFDLHGNILGNVAHKTIVVVPEIPAGKMPYMLKFNFPKWDASHLNRVRNGTEALRIGIVLSYREHSNARFCEEISSINKDSDLLWGPCDLSFVNQMESAKSES
jgi:hypothetical protein